jgi:hypothetical protein
MVLLVPLVHKAALGLPGLQVLMGQLVLKGRPE